MMILVSTVLSESAESLRMDLGPTSLARSLANVVGCEANQGSHYQGSHYQGRHKEQRLAKCSEKAPLLQRVLVGPGCGI